MNPFTSLKMFVEGTVVVFVNKSQVSLVFIFYGFVLDGEQEGFWKPAQPMTSPTVKTKAQKGRQQLQVTQQAYLMRLGL